MVLTTLQHGEKAWVYAYDGWYQGSVLRRAQIPDRPKVGNATPIYGSGGGGLMMRLLGCPLQSTVPPVQCKDTERLRAGGRDH